MERNDSKFPTAIIAIVAAVVAVAVILMAVFAYFASRNPYYGYGGYGYGMMGGFGGLGMLFMIPIMLIVLVVIGYVIWRGVGWGRGCGGHYGYYHSYEGRENAIEILRQRYARGEISKEQFDQMRRDLVA